MRILLADSRPRVRFALQALLEEQRGLQIVAEAAHSRDLLGQVEATCPDLLLLSWELPGCSGVELLPQLREARSQMYVIVLSGRQAARGAALAAGADAFVSKIAPPERLLAAIQAAKSRRDASTSLE